MRSFAVEWLGCKVNQYEVQALREGLLHLGLVEAGDPSGADLFVINTCSVTAHAGATSRNRIRRAVRANPSMSVVATGCYAESDRGRLEALPGVARVFGNADKDTIVGWVGRELLGRGDVAARSPLRLTSAGGTTRAFVKIEDGCDDSCTFCIIPLLRGPAQSRDPAEIEGEVRDLVLAGHREVVLTGVHLGYFGKEQGRRGEALLRLLERLAAIDGLERLKLSSIEVHELSRPLLDVLASSPRFAPHFHVPLQSGSDRVLAAMRRKYNVRLFADRVAALRARLDSPAISTDVIVGFPGETDDDFARTLELCERLAFMKIHVFPYSVREGTEAAALSGHLSPAVIDARKTRLLELDERAGAAWRDRFVGSVVPVLVEARRDPGTGLLSGLSDRYLRVLLDGPDRLMGSIIDVRGVRAGPDRTLVGERVAEGALAP